MKAQSIDIRQASGKILSCTVFRTGGKKLLSKGHVISEDDIRLLELEGMDQVSVTQLDEGEVLEDDAVIQVAREMSIGACEIRLAPGGRANILATENCSVLVDEELLRQINFTASIAIATLANFSFAAAGQRICTIKSAPFAVPTEHLEAVVTILKERGPMLQARPVREPVAAVLYTDPVHPDRARQLFEPIMVQRLERLGVQPRYAMSAVESDGPLAKALEHITRMKPTVVLVASTTAPAGPEDAIGRAMVRIGCQIERFLAPVEPGNLLLLGYREEIPVISAPGCFRSAKANVVDLILPPLLARYRVSSWEVAALGHGGLLC